jgi:hypothetical protein
MCFGAMQVSKANTKVTQKSVLYTIKMTGRYIDEKLLTITVISGRNDWVRSSCFFVDYRYVVTFDTTYRTNRYSMPLDMFAGFNNQLQNVVFAQALIRDELIDTFEWVFQQFKNCMGGKDPITIFTGKQNGWLLL